MKVTLIPRGGIGRSAPLTVEASMVLVEHDDGTVVAVAAEYGTDRAVSVSHARDPEFNRTLAQLGVDRLTVCDDIILPRPPVGARLVAGPGVGK